MQKNGLNYKIHWISCSFSYPNKMLFCFPLSPCVVGTIISSGVGSSTETQGKKAVKSVLNLNRRVWSGSFSGVLPCSMTSWMLTLWSLNHPGISTLQPYSPPSVHPAFRMVRDTSPSPTLPSSWYLGDCVNSEAPSTEERMVLEHLNMGTLARPQQNDSGP